MTKLKRLMSDHANEKSLIALLEGQPSKKQQPVPLLNEYDRHIKILEETILFAEEYAHTLHITIKQQALHTYIIGTLHDFKGFEHVIIIRDHANQLHRIAFLDIIDAYIIN